MCFNEISMSTSSVKIVTHIPVGSVDEVLKAMGDAGAGKIGNYSHCSFSSRGIGRSLPLEGANPTIGTVGNLEEIEEERVELTCEKELLPAVVAALRNTHPYEEPTYDVYERLDV